MIKVGVELKDEELPEKFEGHFLVLSFERYLLFSKKEKEQLKHWLKQGSRFLKMTVGSYLYRESEDPELLRERFLLLPTACQSLSIKIPHGHFRDSTSLCQTIKTLNKNRDDWSTINHETLTLNLELGSDLAAVPLAKQLGWGLRFDPLWSSDVSMLDHSNDWVLSGKHPDRWVRLYSPNQLKHVLDLATEKQKQKKSTQSVLNISFSHSQRWVQYKMFLEFSRSTSISTESLDICL